MRRAAAAAVLALAAACVHDTFVQHQRIDLGKAMPAELDPGAPHVGEIKVAKIRVYADADFRGHLTAWKKRVTGEIDYANEMLQPLLGVRLEIVDFKEWDYQAPTAPLDETLGALAKQDSGDDVAWVIGFTGAVPLVTNAQHELGMSEVLGKHLVVRGYADNEERAAFLRAFPSIDEKDIDEVLGARRRHKQTTVLLHELGHTLGAIHETADESILNATYSAKVSTISDRNRQLMQIVLDDRLKIAELRDPQGTAAALLAAIEGQEWGGWIAADRDQEIQALHRIVDRDKVTQTATDVPAGAADQYAKAESLARAGKVQEALDELQPVIEAYPGNAQIRTLACRIQLVPKGPPSKAAQDVCGRAAELAQGDPGPYIELAIAYARTDDLPSARAQLAQAGTKIPNLHDGQPAAWAQLAGLYQQLGDVTHAEDAAAQAQGAAAPIATWAKQTRARYGDPRDGARWKITPDNEADYVAAVREILELGYANKFGPAAQRARAAEKRWPGAPGLAADRCDLGVRQNDEGAARAACKAALAAFPGDSWALYLDGVIELRHDDQRGIARLKQAIAIDPDLAQAWRALAKVYQRDGDHAALDQLRTDYQAAFGTPL
jgi:predicted Zn-dependent protease